MAATSPIFILAALLGCALAVVGSVFDKLRLGPERSRRSGWLCLLCSAIFFVLFWAYGNVHTWTLVFFFPMLAGLISAAIFLF
jgi:hypothetical protein